MPVVLCVLVRQKRLTGRHTGRPGKVNASSPGGIETQTVQPRAEP
nr:MAG TPA: hypothetical protein [Caudoviricetes sp.]